jgi:phage terminase large subunit-like protein
MNDLQQLQQAKEQCIADLSDALSNYANRLNSIDERLMIYIEDALSNNASHANLYELLGIRKTLRLMDSYDLDIPRARRKITAIEGQWKDGRHVKGGLKFSTPRGQQHVRLMPFQVYAECSIHMFVTDVCMERPYYEGDALLPSEWVGKDGMVWDTRRLIQEAHWFFTRKSGKTELGAAEDFTEVCFLGDVNGQALIATNSSEQSQIAYKAIREFAMQIDPTCTNRMGGKLFRMTRNGMNWQPGHRMKGEIKCLSAGKTSKDGLYASVVHADEHGQARYVNGVSDMQSTVETAWGSTGPRREKLLLHTTTAGKVKDGPYKTKLEQVEASLLQELDYPLGEPHRTPEDYWTAMLLQLDKWEVTDDLSKLDDPELFKKVNRSIGTTVQPTYYRERLHEAATGTDDTKQEVLTKDFNMWQSDRFVKWLSGDQIRPRQVERRITDCKYEDGWNIFVGLDFGGNDDLFAITYLGVNYRQNMPADQRMFADTEAWIVESAMKDSPNRALYEMWAEQGWLKVCPGEVFNPDYAINDLMAKNQQGLNLFMFGYDPAQSIQPINTIKAWLQSLGIDAQTIKRMVVPVPQSFVNMNGLIQKLEWLLLGQEYNIDSGGWSYTNDTPFLYLSNSPLWPWCFGNAKVEISSSELRAIRKTQQHTKIDPIHALLDACYVFDLSEGNVQQ